MIPHFPEKYDAEAFYEPDASVGPGGLPDLPPAAILGFDARASEVARERGDPVGSHSPREFEFYRLSEGVAFVPVEEVGVGAPVAAIAAERVVAAGAQALVVLGGCGAVQPGTPPDAVLLPTEAIRDEGASYHYLPADRTVRATPDLVETLAATFRDGGLEARRGPTWTTSALYRETLPEIDHYRREGVVSVDMESSAVWAVCQYRDVAGATVHHVDGYLSREGPEGDGDRGLPALLDPTVRALESHLDGA